MGNNKKLLGGLGLIGLIIAGLAIYLVFFRDNSAASVNTAEADEARQAAIAASQSEGDGAGGDAAETTDDGYGTDESAEAQDEAAATLDTAQPDSAASVGLAATDGIWNVDTSIGVFDDSCLTEVCSATFAGFRIDEELANFGAKTVVGRTGNVSGSLELNGSQVVGAEFVVDTTTLVTDNGARTGALRGPNGGLETDTFPEARFELTQPMELGEVPAEGVAITVNAVGNLTVHGVTREVTIPLTAEIQAGVIVVFGSLEGMLLADYDIPKPTAAVVVSVEDNATMEFQIFFSR